MAIVTSRKPVWLALAATLIGHSLLISFQTNHRIDTSFVRSAILDVLAPFEMAVDRILYGAGNAWSRYVALIGVRDENERLRSQITELTVQLARQEEEVSEAQRLRSLLGLSDSGIGQSVVARVIGRDPSQGNQSVTIDKGRTHGIQPDTPVITPQGIVGRVIYAGNYASVVQLILDSQSGIGVLFLPKRRLGILRGTGTSELDMDYVDDDTDLGEGNEVVTSGQDRIYPKGLPVGVISAVGGRRGLFKTIRVRPRVDMNRLEEVLCIISRSQPGETAESIDRPPRPEHR